MVDDYGGWQWRLWLYMLDVIVVVSSGGGHVVVLILMVGLRL